MEKLKTESVKGRDKSQQKLRRRHAFHELWTMNVGKMNYDKQYWRAFEQRLEDEGLI